MKYVVIEWFGNHPILDGSLYFDTKDEALAYASNLIPIGKRVNPEFNITIVRIKKYEKESEE